MPTYSLSPEVLYALAIGLLCCQASALDAMGAWYLVLVFHGDCASERLIVPLVILESLLNTVAAVWHLN